MASEDAGTIGLKDDFYRDSFSKVVLLIGSLLIVVLLLITVSIYLYMQKPRPTTFAVAKDWRVQRAVPVNQPYLTTPELLQWASDAVRHLFIFNFYDYDRQLKQLSPYFTAKGWEIFLDQLNNYANKDEVTSKKMFVNGAPSGAPIILNAGILAEKYSWWVEVPMKIHYQDSQRRWDQFLTMQILIVRVPTLNNLSGIGIENIIVPNRSGG